MPRDKSHTVTMVYTTIGSAHPDKLLPEIYRGDYGAMSIVPPQEIAHSISEQLLVQRLAFCINMVSCPKSFYLYEGTIKSSDKHGEILLQIKTLGSKADAVMQRLAEIHPYETPMIWYIDIDAVHSKSMPWILESLGIEQ